MGLFNEVIALARGGGAEQGQHAGALSAILDYLNSPQVGGLSGLEETFQHGGLGNIFSSWIASGQNLPVSAEQLQNVLHSGTLEQVAQKSGIDATQLTGLMSSLLPHLVDKLSPNGQLPDTSAFAQVLKGLVAGKS
jgi:uncharacterized protein YidB (DUF937 family)